MRRKAPSLPPSKAWQGMARHGKALLFLPHPASLSGPLGSSQSCTCLGLWDERNWRT